MAIQMYCIYIHSIMVFCIALIDIRHAGKYDQYNLKFNMESYNWWFVDVLPFAKSFFRFAVKLCGCNPPCDFEDSGVFLTHI